MKDTLSLGMMEPARGDGGLYLYECGADGGDDESQINQTWCWRELESELMINDRCIRRR